jgi:thioredoxin-like negative regulator of GroEL
MELLRDVAPRFTESTYNVLTNNCNNFTDECA